MDFNSWKQFYKWEFCTKEDLKQAVTQGMLTLEQYNEIVNPITNTQNAQNPTNTNGITITAPESTTSSVNTNTPTQIIKPSDNTVKTEPVTQQTTPSTQQ